MVMAYNLLDIWHLPDDVLERRLSDSTTAYKCKYFGILAGKMTNTYTRNGTCTCCRNKITAEMTYRLTGLLIVKHSHKDTSRKTVILITGIRTIPLAACHVKSTAEISRHSDKTTIRTVLRHVLEVRLLREGYIYAVAVVVRTTHDIVTLGNKLENLFGIVDTKLSVIYTGFYYFRL